MNKSLFALFVAIISFTACEKESIQIEEETKKTYRTVIPGNCQWTYDFYAGQGNAVGTITVSNDNNNIYVTYNTAGLALLFETYLFVGQPNDVPVDGSGNPVVGSFPYSETHNGITSYTYTIPINPHYECYVVVASASVTLLEESFVASQQQTAWINQCHFNEDEPEAGYGKYCLMDCD